MHPPKGYKYKSMLGKGQATTWLAESIDGGQDVVIKTLELNKVSDWKGIELFEREVNVLQQLDYPSIPKFIDFIKDEHEGSKRWHIVQEKIDGEKLDPEVAWSEKELRELAVSVLESLVYLQSFSPPLFHRDVKPDNLIKKVRGYSLIDFGAVRHVIPSDLGGSTVAGTSGYLAPEQLMGRADKSSDLYGLGMTLVHIISGKHPDDLGKKRMRIQWSEYKNSIGEAFGDFVCRLTEPHAEDRFLDAEEALEFLNKPTGPPTNLIRREKSWVKISMSEERDLIRVRGMRVRSQKQVGLFLFILLLSSMFLAIVIFTAPVVNPLLFVIFLVVCSLATLVWLSNLERINTTIRHTENGIEMTGGHGLSLLSKTVQSRLDDEVHKLSVRYLDEKSRNKDKLAKLFIGETELLDEGEEIVTEEGADGS